MVSSSILALSAIFLICFHAPLAIFSIFPEFLSLDILLTAFFLGPRAVFALLPAAWMILSAAWAIEDRLPMNLHGRDIRLTGVVCGVPAIDAGVQRFPFLVDADDRLRGLPARVLVSWYESETQVHGGERWQLTVRLKRPRGTRNPDGFDFERWAFLRNIGATGYIRRSVTNRRLSPPGAGCHLTALRERVAADLEAAVPGAGASGHLLALAVGIRSRLSDDDWKVLRRTGTAHLMAISGLHIGLAAGFAFFCSRQIARWLLLARIECRPLVLARVGALSGASFYSALAGFSVPTVRALVMTSVVILFTGLRRPLPIPVVMAIALYAILWLEPLALLSSGFWLSFGAVFVLLLSGFGAAQVFVGPRSRMTDAAHRGRQLLWAQLCLGIGLMPATGLFFGQVSLVAPVANLVVVPLFAVSVVPILMIGIIALFVFPPLAGLVLGFADLLLTSLIRFLEALNRLPMIALDIPRLPGLTLAICVVIGVVLIWPRPLPARIRAILVLSLLATVAGARYSLPMLRVVVMDVGQGLAVLLQTPGYAVLFDTGPRFRRGDAGRSVVLPVLRHFGVSRLDRIIISHGDADHAGGVWSVLEAFPDADLMAPGPIGTSGDRFGRCRGGQRWRNGGASFLILHPGAEADTGRWSENDASCVLFAKAAQARILLPGDIERRAEHWLVANGAIPRVDLVIAPHHGSRTSSTDAFIAATQPAFVVFSAGYRNRWGFPARDVEERWRAVDACLLTTGDFGALVFETDDGGVLRLVTRYRVDEPRVWTDADSAAAEPCGSSGPTN